MILQAYFWGKVYFKIGEYYKATMSESESSKDNLTIHVGTVVNIPANTTIVGDVRISEKHEIHIKCNPIIAALSFSVGALFAYFIYLIKKTTCTNTNTNHAGKK